jgi:hypothetical protein
LERKTSLEPGPRASGRIYFLLTLFRNTQQIKYSRTLDTKAYVGERVCVRRNYATHHKNNHNHKFTACQENKTRVFFNFCDITDIAKIKKYPGRFSR